jgi:hypothetical protein
VFAKESVIRRFLDECFDPDEYYNPQLDILKLFDVTQEEFLGTRVNDTRKLLDDSGFISETQICGADIKDFNPDGDAETELSFECLSAWKPPIGVVKHIAKRYQCAVAVTYSEPDMRLHGSFACRYDPKRKRVVVTKDTRRRPRRKSL